MAHEIFISYSHLDRTIADEICVNLESAGLCCWIAPRDITPGVDWPTAISNAISASRVMVLVFSANSNSSKDVGRELILADNNNLILIPFKIENILPEPGKQYYLARTHWLDAENPPTQEQVDRLVGYVKSFISGQQIAGMVQPAPVVMSPPAEVIQPPPSATPPPSQTAKAGSTRHQKGVKGKSISILGILLLLAIVGGGILAIRSFIQTITPALATVTSTFMPTSAITLTQVYNLEDMVRQKGYMIVSADLNYEPQSFQNPEGVRPANTKCPSDILTAAEMQGFDVDVAVEIGARLGVETCFVTPDWESIISGNWAGKWDLNIGSMTAVSPRPEVLYFTTPYYASSVAVIAVAANSDVNSIDDLAGKALCVGTDTSYEKWLNGTLNFSAGDTYVQLPANVGVVPLESDQECARQLDASSPGFVGYVTSKSVVDANITAGMSVRQLGGPVFGENNRVAFDKSASLDPVSLFEAVDQIIIDMHKEGKLSELSNKWFGADLTQGLVK